MFLPLQRAGDPDHVLQRPVSIRQPVLVVSPIEPEEEVVYLFLDPSAQQGQELKVRYAAACVLGCARMLGPWVKHA